MANTKKRKLREQEATALLRVEMAQPRKAHSVREKEAKENVIAHRLVRLGRAKQPVETPGNDERLIP